MDFAFTRDQQKFREEVRGWIAANAPEQAGGSVLGGTGTVQERFQRGLAWERTLYEGGWAGISWPREYGGRGASAIEALIFAEELARADAPEPVNMVGLVTAGPTIMAVGTPDQKQRFLPPILRGEEVWCQGFSEPDAGSDLRSLRTRAVRTDGGYELTGVKVWTTFAQFSRRCILLARTSDLPSGGITCFAVDMNEPGMEIRPLRQLTGEYEFNEVLFDGVFVADEDILGAVDEGWDVVRTALANERGVSALAQHVEARSLVSMLTGVARESDTAGDLVVRQSLAGAYSRARITELLNYRTVTALAHGRSAGSESSVTKLFFSETQRRAANLGTRLLGPRALAAIDDDETSERLQRRFLWSVAGTIAGGTSEIQRNIIGERVLGLPREPR